MWSWRTRGSHDGWAKIGAMDHWVAGRATAIWLDRWRDLDNLVSHKFS